MRCPICNGTASLVTPDYGYGYGTEYRCYAGHGRYGEYSWTVDSDEAKQESNNAHSASYAYALQLREQK